MKLYNIILLTFTIAFTTACGQAPQGQDNRLQGYISKFDTQYSVYVEQDIGSQMATYFPRADMAWGSIDTNMNLHKEISINLAIWFFLSETSKTNLVYKYEAMVYWNRSETTSTFQDGCPNSLMNKVLINDDCFNGHKDDLLAELPR